MPEAPKEPETIFAPSSLEHEHGLRASKPGPFWKHWMETKQIRMEAEAEAIGAATFNPYQSSRSRREVAVGMPEEPKEPETIFALSSWELKHWARSGKTNLPWEYWAEGQRMRAELAENDRFKFLRTEAPDSPENHAQRPFRPGGQLPE